MILNPFHAASVSISSCKQQISINAIILCNTINRESYRNRASLLNWHFVIADSNILAQHLKKLTDRKHIRAVRLNKIDGSYFLPFDC